MHIDILTNLSPVNISLILNGVYDILCSVGILWFSDVPFFSELSKLHTNMFAEEIHRDNPVIKRLLAYWLMTYGLVRLSAGLFGSSHLYFVAAMTYFIEAFCFEYENRVGKTMISYKVTFVSVFSVALGCICLLNKQMAHSDLRSDV